MNPATLAYIGLGLDALIKLWAIETGKPDGWEPTAADWAELRKRNREATPEAVAQAAREHLKRFTGPTTGT